jgi:hypothetical protein
VRGDGIDIPQFVIIHTSKMASKASKRRCAKDDIPVRGMTNDIMLEYIDHLAKYVKEPSLLIMDRLSSHKSSTVLSHIRFKKTTDGESLLIPFLLPAKTAFLISPLDMGAIAAFKSHLYKYERGTLHEKKVAMELAWRDVSNESLAKICHNCGIIGEESIETIRQRFLKEVVGEVPEKLGEMLDYYDAWKAGAIDVEGANRGRGVTTERPQQLAAGHLDGVQWVYYGRNI